MDSRKEGGGVDVGEGHRGVGEDLFGLPRLFVGAVPAFRFDPGEPAASVGALVGHRRAEWPNALVHASVLFIWAEGDREGAAFLEAAI